VLFPKVRGVEWSQQKVSQNFGQISWVSKCRFLQKSHLRVSNFENFRKSVKKRRARKNMPCLGFSQSLALTIWHPCLSNGYNLLDNCINFIHWIRLIHAYSAIHHSCNRIQTLRCTCMHCTYKLNNYTYNAYITYCTLSDVCSSFNTLIEDLVFS